MAQAVVLTPEQDLFKGEYDGYGNVGEHSINYDFEAGKEDNFKMFHWACWRQSGCPPYGKSPETNYSEDQGFLFEEDDYDFPMPMTATEVLAISNTPKMDWRTKDE